MTRPAGREYPKFKALLRSAIGARTQAQFANETGISAEHLSRMLNSPAIHRPNKGTLLKIAAAASNGVDVKAMVDALDEDDGTVSHPSARRAAQAMRDFAPTFREMACKSIRLLHDEIRDAQYPVVEKSIADHVSKLIRKATRGVPDVAPISYDVGPDRPNFGKRHGYAPRWAEVSLSMAGSDATATATLLVYFTAIPGPDGKSRYAVQLDTLDMADVDDQLGLPGKAIEDMMAQPTDEADGLPEATAMARLLPYWIDFSPLPARTKEISPGEMPFRWAETLDGFGFWIDGTPDGLAAYLAAHAKPVLDAIEPEEGDEAGGAIYDRIATAIDEWGALEDSPGIARDLEAIGYGTDDDHGGGWPAAVAEILRSETGFPFRCYAPSVDPTGTEKISGMGCVMIRKADIERLAIKDEPLLFALGRCCKALGIDRFGDLLFTWLHESARTPRSYEVLRDGEDAHGDPLPLPDFSVEFDGTNWPGEPGLYPVELKDGRRMDMACLALQDGSRPAWAYRSKDWTDMVARYDPKGLPARPLRQE